MSLITLGKIFLALSTTVGGGTSIYFLTKSSNFESSAKVQPKVDCTSSSNSFKLELLDRGTYFVAKSREQAEELAKESYSNERYTITQLPSCSSSSADTQN